MKSPHSSPIEQSKIKLEYVGRISKKPKEKTILAYISPLHKLQHVFDKRENIQKYQVDQKKQAEKKKNMTCINLGVDQEYLEPSIPTQQAIIKIKTKQRYFQSQRKNRSKYVQIKKEQSHNFPNKNFPKPQSQHQKRFQFFEVNRQNENLMKFEKKLIPNLHKKKDPKNNGKHNFYDKFKQIIQNNSNFYRNFSSHSLSIKKQIIHQTPLEIQEKDEENKTFKGKFLRSKQCITFHRYNTSHNQRSYLHKKLSQGQLKPSITSLVLYENQLQEQISCNQTLDEIKIQKHKAQSYSASNILSRNKQTQQKINNSENQKTKTFYHQQQLNKLDLNKFQRNINRSLNVSAHTKVIPSQKIINLKQKQKTEQKIFLKSRNTYPAIQSQPSFTPWDHLPSQRSLFDQN